VKAQNLCSVAFVDTLVGVAVGSGGVIVRTSDGGGTWTETESGTMNYLGDVTASSPTTFIAVGEHGTILRTTTGGVTWVEDRPAIPQSVTLAQNYPNPFNPTTTIQYSLQKPQRVLLIVTDLYGREVRRVIDGNLKEAGSHQVAFDSSGLPSGVYFYSLIVGEQRITRKMVVLR